MHEQSQISEPKRSISLTHLAVLAYLEPVLDRRRVLWLGEYDDHVVAQLEFVVAGARYRTAMDARGMPFDDETFDAIVVWDVHALAEPWREAVAELRRVLTRTGVLVMTSELDDGRRRRRSGGGQGTLLKLLEPEFRMVRVVGQSEFRGYTLAEQRAGNPSELAIDMSLTHGHARRVIRQIAVASDAKLALDPSVLVELPPSQTGGFGAVVDLGHDGGSNALREARESLSERTRALREAESRLQQLEVRVVALEADVDDSHRRVIDLQAELGHSADVTHEANAQLGQLRAQSERARGAVERAESERARATAERDAARKAADQAAEDAASIETRLKDRGARVRELEREVKRRATIARDLVEELGRVGGGAREPAADDERLAVAAERDRAVRRAVDAEVEREALRLDGDELRARLALTGPSLAKAREAALEGELLGTQLRLSDAEAVLRGRPTPVVPIAAEPHAQPEPESRLESDADDGLSLRRMDSERVRVMGAEILTYKVRLEEASGVAGRLVALEHELAQSRGEGLGHQLRAVEAERALSETSTRLADAARGAQELSDTRDMLDRAERNLAAIAERHSRCGDELRAVEARCVANEQALSEARAETDATQAEASARIELARRREADARGEREIAVRSLEEARALLARIASRVEAGDIGGLASALETISGEELAQSAASRSRASEDRGEEVRRLNEQLGDKEAELLLANARASAVERERDALRVWAEQARNAIEAFTHGARPDAASLLEDLPEHR